MTREEMMQAAWMFISDCGITEDPAEYTENDQLYLVE